MPSRPEPQSFRFDRPTELTDSANIENLAALDDYINKLVQAVRKQEKYDSLHEAGAYDTDAEDLAQEVWVRLIEGAMGQRAQDIVEALIAEAIGLLRYRLAMDLSDDLRAIRARLAGEQPDRRRLDTDGVLRWDDDDQGSPVEDDLHFGESPTHVDSRSYSRSEFLNFVHTDWTPDNPSSAGGWRVRERFLACHADVERAWSWATRVIPPDVRSAFLMTHMLGYPQRDAADVLGVHRSTVARDASSCADVMLSFLNGDVDELAVRRRRREAQASQHAGREAA